ncbi:hypothetical protein PMAYCL1PPCAC_18303, partial [Pristionchus mayeri]
QNFCPINGYTIYTYNNFLETFITLFRASMGGYDYEEFACANYEALTKTLFVLYMFVMPIMMINILIAMMGNTYTTVIAQAEKAWRQQYAQIVMVLERSVNKEKLAQCQLEYSIKLSETNEVGLETRGLMVIKQTKKTRAKQRKQAINNWKKIVRKVIQTIDRVGSDHAIILLHSHDRIVEETAALKMDLSGRVRSPSTRLMTSRRMKSRDGGEKEVRKKEGGRNIDTLTLDRDEEQMGYQLSVPSSLNSDGLQWEERKMVEEERMENGLKNEKRKLVRGLDVSPSSDIPNLPSSSTPSSNSKKIHHDMFRRKDSPHNKNNSRESTQSKDGN